MNRILLIEDDAAYREITEKLYRMTQKVFHGEVAFLTASDWVSGLAIIRSDVIDVAIVDLTLPPMDKYDTLRAIKSERNLPPIVILTGHEGDNTLRTASIIAGADDFILKSEVRRHPELLCERVYVSYLRNNRARYEGT